MAINERGAKDSRHARNGSDGAIYSGDGEMLATVESFVSQVNFTNGSYKVLGMRNEVETAGSYKVTLQLTQVVIESDRMIRELIEALETGIMPVWNFQGTLQGLNGSEERVVYRDCIPSGTVDLQNLTVGDTVKRAWNFAVNRPPKLQSLLTIDEE